MLAAARLLQGLEAMHPDTTPIDIAEAAYDLELGPEDWLPNLLDKGAPIFDQGHGAAAAIWAGISVDGQPLVAQMCVVAGPEDLALRFARAARAVGTQLEEQTSAAHVAGVRTAAESEHGSADVVDALRQHVGCEDVLGVWAFDPDLHGVGINIPSSQRIELSKKTRERWQRLAVHISAGHRLRRRLGCTRTLRGAPVSDIPLEADAVVDPRRFVITHAEDPFREKSAAEALRDAALRVDQARSKLRNEDPDKALELWQGLVRGEWSLVDWFDTDDRRYVLVIPNPPGLGDPRGLTEHEHQVVTYAAQGESSKMIHYRLGVSKQRISRLLRSAMRKLRVRTHAELVMKLSGFRSPKNDAA